MTLSIQDVCEQYAWLYTATTPPTDTWDHLISVDGCWCAIKNIDGINYLMFRGSITFMDWKDDFDDCALEHNDPVLGPVHPGFRDGVLSVKIQLDKLLGTDPVVIVGHSLGAGHTALYAGYRVAAGLPVANIVAFGEPRPGGPKLSDILKDVPLVSYCNGDANGYDLVTAVPRSLPPILRYQHMRDPLTSCSAAPATNDPWLAFRYHHFSLYCKALGADGPAIRGL